MPDHDVDAQAWQMAPGDVDRLYPTLPTTVDAYQWARDHPDGH